MMNADAARMFDRVRADGGDGPVSEEMLNELKSEVEEIAREMQARWATARVDSESVRFCEWNGQSPDGRKWAARSNGQKVGPFEGATDSRVGLADALVDERKALKVLAALRSQTRVRPLGPDDDRKAARVQRLLTWLLNRWGSRWVVELTRLADYVESDDPAAALAGVYWRREWGLRYEDVTVDSMLEKFVEFAEAELAGDQAEESLAMLADAGMQLREALEDELREDEAAGWIQTLFPYVSEKRALKVARALRLEGRARFPVRFVVRDEPEVVSHRLLEEAWLPRDVRDFERAPLYFVTETLTRQELLARVATEGWSKKWVEGVVGKPVDGGPGLEGRFFLPVFERDVRSGDPVARVERNRFQVAHAYFRAVNEDGVPGCYELVFHPDAEGTAFGRRLLDLPHGGFPGVLFVREVISSRLLDARGVSGLVAADQGLLKLAHDTTGDVAQFGLPPVITIGRRSGAQPIRLGPLEQNDLPRNGDVKWLQPPSSNGTWQLKGWIEQVDRQVDRRFGRPVEGVPAEVSAARQEYDMALWLGQVRDVLRLVVQYCQQFLPEDVLARVVDEDGRAVFESRDDIQGMFDVEMSFEPRDLNLEFLEQKTKLYQVILNSLDSRQVADRAAVVSSLMFAVDGPLAARAVQDVSRADEREAEDERLNFLKIAAGLPVEMAEDGQNWALRLETLQGIAEQAPGSVQLLPPERQEAFLERVKHLEFMAQQGTVNAQAGRVGVIQGEG